MSAEFVPATSFSSAFDYQIGGSTVNSGVAPQYGKTPDGRASGGLLDGITQLANAFGAAAPAIAAIKGNKTTVNVAGREVPLTDPNQRPGLFDNMDQKTMILLGVGALAAFGLIVFVATRK